MAVMSFFYLIMIYIYLQISQINNRKEMCIDLQCFLLKYFL